MLTEIKRTQTPISRKHLLSSPTAQFVEKQLTAAAMVSAAALMPTWSRNDCAASGMCSFGLVFAEWRFLRRSRCAPESDPLIDEVDPHLLLLLLNSLPHPGMVHICISFRCTALVWILSAPLSQNDLLHRSQSTRFFILLLQRGDCKGMAKNNTIRLGSQKLTSLRTLESADSGLETTPLLVTGCVRGVGDVSSTEEFTASSTVSDCTETSSSAAVVTETESVVDDGCGAMAAEIRKFSL